jgi:hypothetical protein
MLLLVMVLTLALVVWAGRVARRTYDDLDDSPRWAWPITGGPGKHPPRGD